jgi:hypothetical protein
MVGSIRRRRRPGTWELRVDLGRHENRQVRYGQVTFEGSKGGSGRGAGPLVAEQEREPERPPADEELTGGARDDDQRRRRGLATQRLAGFARDPRQVAGP